jgi:hypothetical protein
MPLTDASPKRLEPFLAAIAAFTQAMYRPVAWGIVPSRDQSGTLSHKVAQVCHTGAWIPKYNAD